MSSASASSGHSLPPLHQAIPEFHSHNPSIVPRKLHENQASYSNNRTSLSGSDPADYHESFRGNAPDFRKTNSFTGAPSFYTDIRSSHPLPPVSSLTSSSRGSSLDIENERSHSQATYSAHHTYASSYDHDPRTPPHSQDYRYPPNYRSSSPSSYSHNGISPYYHGHAPPGGSRAGDSHDSNGRLPFSPPGTNSELAMDHYDQDRNMGSKRRRGNLPKHVTDMLRTWLNEHLHHPYPTEDEKQMLMQRTGLTIHQISNWFINARRRRVPAINASSDASKSMNARRLS